jgi:hypothetical protein
MDLEYRHAKPAAPGKSLENKCCGAGHIYSGGNKVCWVASESMSRSRNPSKDDVKLNWFCRSLYRVS